MAHRRQAQSKSRIVVRAAAPDLCRSRANDCFQGVYRMGPSGGYWPGSASLASRFLTFNTKTQETPLRSLVDPLPTVATGRFSDANSL
jgi:hypothetical protein